MCDTRNFFGNAAGCKLFLNERDSDVSICVEWEDSRWHFPAHRLILCTMSEVFRTMLNADMVENKNGQITIRDINPLTVRQFLKYLYMGVLDFNGWSEAVDLLKIAHKYGVNTLVHLCETHLTTVISFSNVCYFHEMAQTYSLGGLRKDAANFILETGFIVSSIDSFFNLSSRSFEYFLASTRLNMENECCILSTLREWATVECCRRGYPLTKDNTLSIMEPFMKHLRWGFIPEELRTFVPDTFVRKYSDDSLRQRKSFHVPPSLQHHVSILKFVVELGAYHERKVNESSTLSCLKFGVDSHSFVAGFRIVGMFSLNSLVALGPSSLTLEREDRRAYTQFNLNSLPWTKGTTVGEYVWREMTAYLPYPVRVDPFSPYLISLKYGSRGDPVVAKWPVTRLENPSVVTDLGPINFQCYSQCYGITQLFLLPAPPNRNVCNDIEEGS